MGIMVLWLNQRAKVMFFSDISKENSIKAVSQKVKSYMIMKIKLGQ